MFKKVFLLTIAILAFSFTGNNSASAETTDNVPSTVDVSPQQTITVTNIDMRFFHYPPSSIYYSEPRGGVRYSGTIYLERFFMDPDIEEYFAYYGGTIGRDN